MSHSDLRIPNLKKMKAPSNTALCKTIAMHPPSFSVPDRLSHLPKCLPTFHGTTGRAKHPQTFTKLNEVDIQVTFHKQGKYPSEINR